ncbi:alpha/beta fold hydrolase [Denitrobaculum tricleocarpae]|uniref:Alpha/beta hydrolase n=1 Tax=Denitrobaculum tricleocarpae TaxID=2591009 RepID=A0A545T243_9PROT|nr:alpha/beta hydrolase [Denitrobaculum tricleocarpae]TQV71297.1 alpha/beta hydrolase [Denitrobaculum tricleocarpae]
MFDNFTSFDIEGDGATIHGVKGGQGPALLLLHGYPQTHALWHKVAPALAEHFTVVAADLRGYGASSKPPSVADHASYSKRAMASDMTTVMQELGFERFFVGAHDRGARVAHRMALDWPERVARLAVLDIAPTREMYANTSDGFARAYWHWFFLIQKAPFPERMIEADPRAFWLKKCGSGSAGLTPFSEKALEAYLEAFADPEVIRASCEDYRAAAAIDIAHDDADGERKLSCPLLALWGKTGAIEAHFDCLELWRLRAEDVRGHALPGGHYLAEELPDLVAKNFIDFFSEDQTL